MTALPPAGDTFEDRPAEAPTTEALSLEEAARTYAVSVTTLRRLLRDERLAGAYKVPGPKGSEWRIPSGSLDALGYRAANLEPPAPAPVAASGPDLSALVASLATLTDALSAERRQLMAAEEDRGRAEREREEARVEAARLEAQLAAERLRSADLEARLTAATTRRSLFRRKPRTERT